MMKDEYGKWKEERIFAFFAVKKDCDENPRS